MEESVKDSVEFRGFQKIKRGNPFMVTITEKIDGTNACVIVQDGEVVGAQSRNRMITPENDNAGFAQWVEENKEDLKELGDGYHYGEWAGPGIQKNRHEFPEKTFLLFNSFRWRDREGVRVRPECCEVVPVLFEGILSPAMFVEILNELEATEPDPEGVVVYHHTSRAYTKNTFQFPGGKWAKR